MDFMGTSKRKMKLYNNKYQNKPKITLGKKKGLLTTLFATTYN